jgi:hypothetical protein
VTRLDLPAHWTRPDTTSRVVGAFDPDIPEACDRSAEDRSKEAFDA